MVLFAAFGSLFTGYSLAVFAFTIGQPAFYSSLGLQENPTAPGYSYTNDIIGAANGIFFGTGFVGSFLAAWAGNRLGRVNGFRIAAATGIVGGVLQCASQSPGMVRTSFLWIAPNYAYSEQTVLVCKSRSWVSRWPRHGCYANLLHRSSSSAFSRVDRRCSRSIHQLWVLYGRMGWVSLNAIFPCAYIY